MGRPPKHDVDALLDRAVELAATGGVPSLTMVALAKASGAPSGSLYHRFAGRGGLLAEVWLRTVERFQAGWVEPLTGDDAVEGCVAAARHVVAWSRAHPHEARLLAEGRGAFSPADWPDGAAEREAAVNRRAEAALRAAAARLGGGRDATERVTFATVDLPYGAVRRHLRREDARIPRSAETLVEQAARAVLTGAGGPPAAGSRPSRSSR